MLVTSDIRGNGVSTGGVYFDCVKWLAGPLDHVETLSITFKHLLVTSRHRLQQYSTGTSKLVRVVSMSDDMQLCHAVETSGDTFIVGYRTPLWHYGVSIM